MRPWALADCIPNGMQWILLWNRVFYRAMHPDWMQDHYYLIIFLKIQYSNNILQWIDEKQLFASASCNEKVLSIKKPGEDNLSVACYLQVHRLLAKLTITAARMWGVDNRWVCQQLSTDCWQVFHRVFFHERHEKHERFFIHRWNTELRRYNFNLCVLKQKIIFSYHLWKSLASKGQKSKTF